MKIYLIGAGIARGDLSLRALETIKKADKVFIRTIETDVGKYLSELGFDFTSLDYVYNKSRSFFTLSKNLSSEVLKAAKTQTVAYIVEGDVKDDVSCSIIVDKHKDVEIISGVSKADYYLGKAWVFESYTSVSAYDIENVRLSLPLVVYDIDSNLMASRVKLVLADKFGDDIPCYKFFNGNFIETKLYLSDHGEDFNHSSALVIKSIPLTDKTRFDFDDLHDILKILRSENGCPWDRAQTPESTEKDLIEECYELIDAINTNNEEAVVEELGDLILQTFFYICFEEEKRLYNKTDIISGVCSKLISRHTHIFGVDNVSNTQQALDVWEKNKIKEKKFANATEYLESVPKSFPSVLRAHKVGSRSKKYKMDFTSVEQVADKVKEEFYEVLEEYKKQNEKGIYEESGDLLFAVVSLVRLLGVNGELALNSAVDKFLYRFKKTEELALNNGKQMTDLTDEEADKYYHEAKKY